MITQKGLKQEDVFTLISETGTEATIHIAIPECEKFTETKSYTSREECLKRISSDVDDFVKSHASTTFTIEFSEDEKEEVVNDSWKSIFEDAKSDLKGGFTSRFRKTT